MFIDFCLSEIDKDFDKAMKKSGGDTSAVGGGAMILTFLVRPQ